MMYFFMNKSYFGYRTPSSGGFFASIIFVLLICISPVLILSGCDHSDSPATATGSLSVALKWPESEPIIENPSPQALQSARIDCTAVGIARIECKVYDGDAVDPFREQTFMDCGAHKVNITAIKSGTNRRVKVEAKDAGGNVKYRGEKTGITITKGQTAKIEIEMIDLGTITNSLGMTFKYIPPGTFWMGSPTDELGRDSDETRHQVTLTKGFYMQTTEVTQKQWEEVMGTNPSYFLACGDNCPVERVSWNDIQEFKDAINAMDGYTYRLPTEAEWEYACRANPTSTTAFANGGITVTDCSKDSNLDAMGWYCYNSNNTTHAVKQKQANAWGLYDMHGNVWEWCSDWYGTYPTSAVTDPTGSSTGDDRVLRGGSWFDNAWFCRSAYRYYFTPDGSDSVVGFRLVLLPEIGGVRPTLLTN
jgi:formylglycine-generating enzyme required for sulfatase activity